MQSAAELARAPLVIPQAEREQVKELYGLVRCSRAAALVGPDGIRQEIPNSVYSFLVHLLKLLDEGKSVAITQTMHELSTAEAAKFLGVSRQFLVNLVEKGEIPHHKVGTHRRLYLEDVAAYGARRDRKRREVLEKMVQAEAEFYDIVPPADVFNER